MIKLGDGRDSLRGHKIFFVSILRAIRCYYNVSIMYVLGWYERVMRDIMRYFYQMMRYFYQNEYDDYSLRTDWEMQWSRADVGELIRRLLQRSVRKMMILDKK